MDTPSNSARFEVVAGPADKGRRLDEFLGAQPPLESRSQASHCIDQGLVLVDGRPRSRSHRLAPGERIEVDITGREERAPSETPPAPEDIPIPVVYEDEWLLVADKPAGVVVHPARGHPEGTLVNALVSHGLCGGDPGRPGVVHRLDKDTSGLLVLAKSEEAYSRLSEMIFEREIERVYLALVHGQVEGASGTIEAPVGRNPRRRQSMTVGGVAARDAVTHFRVRERFSRYTYLEAELQTGRTHQIRVHFQAIGHPVAGDPTYGRRDPLGIGRQFLHSTRISFLHPISGRPVEAESDLPQDLAEALARACQR